MYPLCFSAISTSFLQQGCLSCNPLMILCEPSLDQLFLQHSLHLLQATHFLGSRPKALLLCWHHLSHRWRNPESLLRILNDRIMRHIWGPWSSRSAVSSENISLKSSMMHPGIISSNLFFITCALGFPTSDRLATAWRFKDDRETWSKSMTRMRRTPVRTYRDTLAIIVQERAWITNMCAAWLPTPPRPT